MASNDNQSRINPIIKRSTEKCPFTIVIESNTFYKNLSNSFSDITEIANNPLRPGSRHFRNQTQIPNHLKRNTFERSMTIRCIADNKVHLITDLIGERLDKRAQLIYLHITRGQNILILKRQNQSKNVVIDSFQTYILPASKAWMISYQSFEDINVIALEVVLKEEKNPFPIEKLQERIPVAKEQWDLFKSFTLSPIFDAYQQLVYLASRFVYDAEGVPHLAAVTLMNHSGQRIVNTLSCPRKMIINYATPHTGITERQLRGVTDHYQVYETIKENLSGRIIVGYKVSQQLTRMLIDPKIIRGIRDLSTTTAIKKHKPEGELLTFRDLTEFLHENTPKSWTTMTEAALVFRIYKKLAKNWVDDFTTWEEDMQKVPWDVVNRNTDFYRAGDTETNYTISGRIKISLPQSTSLPRIVETFDEVNMEISTDDEYESCDSDFPEKGTSEKPEKITEIQPEFEIENEVWLEDVDDEDI